jgi:hypothetical protein
MARGRKTLFREQIIAEAERMAGLGLLVDQIANVLCINTSTLYRWEKSHPEFREAIKRGQDKANEQVVKSLFKRATGYQFKEITIERMAMNPKKKVRKVVIKEIAPDTTAQIFWLTNRVPGSWADKRGVHVGVGVKVENNGNNVIPDQDLRGVISLAKRLN